MRLITRFRLAALGLAAVALVLALPLGTAAAGAKDYPQHTRLSIDQTFPDDSLCGPPGTGIPVTTRFQAKANEIVRLNRAGFAAVTDNGWSSFTWTSTQTGRAVVAVSTGITTDQSIVDNGDGTITVLQPTMGDNFVIRDASGTVLFRDAGRFVLQLVWDYNGTPADRGDDALLDVHPLTRSGTDLDRYGDVCQAVAASLGVAFP